LKNHGIDGRVIVKRSLKKLYVMTQKRFRIATNSGVFFNRIINLWVPAKYGELTDCLTDSPAS
jgi:hypothetical protein